MPDTGEPPNDTALAALILGIATACVGGFTGVKFLVSMIAEGPSEDGKRIVSAAADPGVQQELRVWADVSVALFLAFLMALTRARKT